MKEKKQQKSAQAISNDNLENVSGGYRVLGRGLFLDLSDEEKKCLQEDTSWEITEPMGISADGYMRHENARKKGVLRKHGFKEEK